MERPHTSHTAWSWRHAISMCHDSAECCMGESSCLYRIMRVLAVAIRKRSGEAASAAMQSCRDADCQNVK